jgi:hypothetical protein
VNAGKRTRHVALLREYSVLVGFEFVGSKQPTAGQSCKIVDEAMAAGVDGSDRTVVSTRAGLACGPATEHTRSPAPHATPNLLP